MDEPIENSVALASHATAGSDASGGSDGQLGGVLQPRPKPSAKHARLSGQPDKEEFSGGSCKMQKVVKVEPQVSNAGAAAATSLPPDIWRLIGQKVNSLPLLYYL